MKFNYQARTQQGEVHTGQVEAASEEGALLVLQKHGFFVTFLEPAATPFYARKVKLFAGVSNKEIVLFSRQLSIMFQSKVPLVESLVTLASQTKNVDFQEKILKLSEEVEGGTPLSRALALYPKVFSEFYIAMVKSGEVSGKLSDVFDYLAEHLEREYHLMSKAKSSLVYPMLIVAVVFIVLGLMMFFVIPQLSQVLLGSGQPLPPITQFVIDLSAFIRAWGWLAGLIIIGLVIVSLQYAKNPKGKRFFDALWLKIPVLGGIVKIIYLSRFAENLSTLIVGGLPITQALETSGAIISNSLYKNAIFEATDVVRQGESISSVLSRYPDLFPPFFIQMILVGEKTGNLDKTLMNMVNFYQKEVDRSIDTALALIEPALIIFLGVIVAGIIMSVLTPMYQMLSI